MEEVLTVDAVAFLLYLSVPIPLILSIYLSLLLFSSVRATTIKKK
jgi:hypothetical protein